MAIAVGQFGFQVERDALRVHVDIACLARA